MARLTALSPLAAKRRPPGRRHLTRLLTVGIAASAVVLGQATGVLAAPTSAPLAEVAVSETLQPVLHGKATATGSGTQSLTFSARTVGSSTWNLLNNVSAAGTEAYEQLPAGILSIGQPFEYQIAHCDSTGCTPSAVLTGYASPALGAGERSGATRLPFTVGDRVSAQVDAGSGNLLLNVNAFSLARRTGGGTLDVGLAYNSVTRLSYASFNGSFGDGWRLTTGGDVKLRTNGDGSVTYFGPGGTVGTFTPTGTAGVWTAPAGFKMDLTPDTGGRLKLYDHDSGETWKFTLGGRLASITDRNNNVVTFTYSGGDLASITSDVGSTGARTLTVTTDSAHFGRITSLSQTPDSGSGLSDRSATFSYDTNDRLTKITDVLGRDTVFAYGSNNNLNSITAPGGAVTSFTYDNDARVVSVTQPTGDSSVNAVTRFAYPAGQTLIADPNSDQAQSVSNAAHTTYAYTTDGRLLIASATDPAGNPRSQTYTPYLDVASATNPAGTTGAGYTANSGESLTSVTSATGAGSSFAYANTAQATRYQASSSTDPQGRQSNYTYNSSGNLVGTQSASSVSASVTYNTDGTVATSTSPTGAVTTYGYDATGQLTSVTPASGNSLGGRSYTYDGFGRIATYTSGRGVTETYSYDTGDRITKVDYSDTTTDVTYTYEAAGGIDTRTDVTGTTSYDYDPLGRLTVRNNPTGADPRYSYDPVGNLASASNAAGTTTYAYDTRNLVTSLTAPDGKKVTFANDTTGRRTDTWFNPVPDGYGGLTWAAHTHIDYDPSSRITRTWTAQNSNDATRVDDLTYSYASPGSGVCAGAPATNADTALRWKQTDNLTGLVTTYCYDASNRLTTATTPGGDAWVYTYNANGDRTQTTKNGTVVQGLAFNNADQITTTGYSYDASGNATAAPSVAATVSYNGAEQMTNRTTTGSGGFNVDYTYAGTDQNELTAISGGRSYAYGRTDGNGVPIIESYNLSGTTYSYLYDPQGTPLALLGANTHYLAMDGLGSPVALINNAGGVTGTYTYDPYGQSTATAVGGSSAINVQTFGYGGGFDDPTSTLVHFGERWYDPVTGRWTQQDSIETLADPTRANRYEYAGDDPINSIDPMGQKNCALAGTVGGILGGIVGGAFGAVGGPGGVGLGASIGAGAGAGFASGACSSHSSSAGGRLGRGLIWGGVGAATGALRTGITNWLKALA